MSNFKDHLINSFDPIFLAIVAMWSLVVASALMQPADHTPRHDRTGTVEIYAVTPVNLAGTR